MNMGFVTDFVTKHTRHATPVVIAGLVFVATPVLVTLDEGMDQLSLKTDARPYDYKKPWIKAAIVGLTALGALMNQAVAERRQKIGSETDFLRRGIEEGKGKGQ